MATEELLDTEVQRLQKLWDSRGEAEHHDQQRLLAKPLEQERLAWCITSFRDRSAHSPEGFHPAHHAMGGEIGVEVFSIILQIFSATCLSPRQISLLLSFLVAKPKGGWRVLNLFSSPYRVWARYGRAEARQFELLNPHRSLAFQSGGGCEDIVVRQALAAEAAVHGGEASFALCWDLKSYYEYLDRGELQSRCEEL